MSTKEKIKKEDWRKAPGVTASPTETNSAFAKRDYSVPCDLSDNLIAVVKGYHIWWCSSHHQPLYKCEIEKLKCKIEKLIKSTS